MGLRLLRVTVGRREDDSVAVRIADPQLAVVRIRIAMNVDQDGRLVLGLLGRNNFVKSSALGLSVAAVTHTFLAPDDELSWRALRARVVERQLVVVEHATKLSLLAEGSRGSRGLS